MTYLPIGDYDLESPHYPKTMQRSPNTTQCQRLSRLTITNTSGHSMQHTTIYAPTNGHSIFPVDFSYPYHGLFLFFLVFLCILDGLRCDCGHCCRSYSLAVEVCIPMITL
jgi:hypothetical protein